MSRFPKSFSFKYSSSVYRIPDEHKPIPCRTEASVSDFRSSRFYSALRLHIYDPKRFTAQNRQIPVREEYNMQEYAIYRDIAARTMGNIYIGVVGPVRTGKSTFIKRFMETLVLPAIPSDADRTRARDELPQSAGGKTVMTTEPKFIPDEAVTVAVSDPAAGQNPTSLRVRMIDCVGYLVPGAVGGMENDAPRMVHTPWSNDPLPFDTAAEIGTHKVIAEHATIGILVTTDVDNEAEQRVVRELQ